jgi:diacylglycerol kinase (ATP)
MSKFPISRFKSKSGIKRIAGAFRYSTAGLKAAWQGEHAFRQEGIVLIIATIVALAIDTPAINKLLLIGVVVLVMVMELVNSAIEAVVDRISLEQHPLSKNAKDFGSAAVFLTVFLAIATWITVLLPLCYQR